MVIAVNLGFNQALIAAIGLYVAAVIFSRAGLPDET
jgi:hypothetical protein